LALRTGIQTPFHSMGKGDMVNTSGVLHCYGGLPMGARYPGEGGVVREARAEGNPREREDEDECVPESV